MKLKIFMISFGCLLLGSCSEKKAEPIDPAGDIPAKVADVTVTPIAGGAVIRYTLPSEGRLLGVKAVYTLTNGKKYETDMNGFRQRE